MHSNWPSTDFILRTAALFGAFVVWSSFCLWLCGWLRLSCSLRVGYTRKIFHLLIFLSAVAAHVAGGFFLVCVFGSAVTLIIAFALVRGDGHPMYEALARPQDRPHRTYYVIIPYVATLAGGIATNLLFGPLSFVGYLVGGIGDAVGEPVGTRWGRHRYRVPAQFKVIASRSVEGSIAVLLGSLLALVIGALLSPHLHLDRSTFPALVGVAACCALIEAISPHGWDNTTMQVLPVFLVSLLR
jgi:phytol kinase